MRVVFRADASIEIGSGHIVRCLTLADELSANGCEIVFICRDLPGNLFPLLENKGYSIAKLPEKMGGDIYDWQLDASETIHSVELAKLDIDLLVVDHYELDKRWDTLLRSKTKKIMVIDDLADRAHDCDFLLDQNYYTNLENRYDGLVSVETNKYLGPKFALLRNQFYTARESLRERNGEISNILIFMGGADSFNITAIALQAVKLIKHTITIDVVIGGSNPHREEVKSLCASMPNVELHIQVDNMAELMVQADLAIGAGGASTWERCYLGLPSITLVFADNQLQTTRDLASIEVINFLGWANECDATDIAVAIQTAIDSPKKMKEMSYNSMNLMSDRHSSTSSLVLDLMS